MQLHLEKNGHASYPLNTLLSLSEISNYKLRLRQVSLFALILCESVFIILLGRKKEKGLQNNIFSFDVFFKLFKIQVKYFGKSVILPQHQYLSV